MAPLRLWPGTVSLGNRLQLAASADRDTRFPDPETRDPILTHVRIYHKRMRVYWLGLAGATSNSAPQPVWPQRTRTGMGISPSTIARRIASTASITALAA